MFQYLLSENIKIKHTFLKKLLWLAPLVTMLLAFFLTFDYFQIDSYNWWYTTILPGMLSLSCLLLIEKDKKMNNRAILSLPVSLKQIWISKVLIILGILASSCMIIFFGSQLFSFLLNRENLRIIPVMDALLGSILLIITFMWQIPLCMFLGSKIGLFPTILLNTGANLIFGITASIKSMWIFVPYAYSSRLMCPVLKVLPNGLQAEPGNQTFTPELLSYGVILPGVLISIVLFILLTYVTARWFENQEAK